MHQRTHLLPHPLTHHCHHHQRSLRSQSEISPNMLVSAPASDAPAKPTEGPHAPITSAPRQVARSMHHVQQQIGPGGRTQFQQLWKQAAQKVSVSSWPNVTCHPRIRGHPLGGRQQQRHPRDRDGNRRAWLVGVISRHTPHCTFS